jgi:hypothetical protein
VYLSSHFFGYFLFGLPESGLYFSLVCSVPFGDLPAGFFATFFCGFKVSGSFLIGEFPADFFTTFGLPGNFKK